MEVTDPVAVSLDELTLDLSGSFLTDREDEQVSPSISPEAYSSFKFNNNEEGINTWNASENNETHTDRIKLYQTDTIDGTKDNGETISYGREREEVNDFEVDIPPLSLFPSARENISDDSDSEFEVPEVNTNSSKTVSFLNDVNTHGNEYNQDSANEQLKNNVEKTHFQPQIITPREVLTTDLSEVPDVIITEQTNTDDVPILRAANDIETVKGIYQPSEYSQNIFVSERPQLPPAPTEFADIEIGEQDENLPRHVNEWDAVQTIQAEFVDLNKGDKDNRAALISKPLPTFHESWNELESQDYSTVKDEIKPRIERKGFSAFAHMLFGPPKLQNDLVSQRDLIFCVAATPLKNDNKTHTQVLQTVYRCLTGSKFDCQRFGDHWEEVGFQGRDPATDLRGTGMLALLHLLFFLREPSTKELARDVYKLSLHPTQNFPFCVMGINLTRICLQVLREEMFNRECNRRKDVVDTINSVYAALFLKFYLIWKQGKTIADSGFVLKEVEIHCRKHAKTIFKDLETHEKMRKLQGPFVEAEPEFFSVCKEDKCDTKSTAELY